MAFFKSNLMILAFAGCILAQDYNNYLSSFQHYNQQINRPAPQTVQPDYSGPINVKKLPSTSTPVPILKQIDVHHDDGSYTYGFEAADGSFKIETKSLNGEVRGKYGYVDFDGKVRTVQYGANRHGFQPSGTGITVPPPTLVDETTRRIKAEVSLEHDEENYPSADMGEYIINRFQQSPKPARRQRVQVTRRKPPARMDTNVAREYKSPTPQRYVPEFAHPSQDTSEHQQFAAELDYAESPEEFFQSPRNNPVLQRFSSELSRSDSNRAIHSGNQERSQFSAPEQFMSRFAQPAPQNPIQKSEVYVHKHQAADGPMKVQIDIEPRYFSQEPSDASNYAVKSFNSKAISDFSIEKVGRPANSILDQLMKEYAL